jgi:hypothetical protein
MGYKSPVLTKPKTTTPPPAVQKAIKKELASMLKAQQKEQAKEDAENGITDDQQGDWEQSDQGGNDWDGQGDWNQQDQQQDWNQDQQQDWNNEGQQQDQQQGDGEQLDAGKEEGQGENSVQPWASWDHSTPPPGQTWDGVGRPVEDGAQSSTTTTPCEEVEADPVRCRPKLPGDPTRGGLKDKKEADVDYLFKKNAALGPILRNASPSGGVMAATLVAGALVLAAAVASLAARRRRSERGSSSSGADALVASGASPQRARSLLQPAPSSQSLLTLSAEAV